MTKRKPSRKPKGLNYKELYTGFMPYGIYVGASYYEESAQIHLSLDEAKELHKFLSKAIKYLEGKEKQMICYKCGKRCWCNWQPEDTPEDWRLVIKETP